MNNCVTTPEQREAWAESQTDFGAANAKLKRLFRRHGRLQAAKAVGTHTSEQWSVLHDIFGRCVACGVEYQDLHGGGATKDHIVQLSLGGCDCLANLQPACRACNSRGIGEDLRAAVLPGWQTIYLHRQGLYF
jgi:hypothetical protein